MDEMFSLEELKAKTFDIFKDMCVSHLQEDILKLQESDSYEELAKHLYGIYRIFAGHAKLAYDYAENKDNVMKFCNELEEIIQETEDGRL